MCNRCIWNSQTGVRLRHTSKESPIYISAHSVSLHKLLHERYPVSCLWTSIIVAMGNCCQSLWNSPKNTDIRISLPAVCFVWQTAMIILFGVFVRYNEESDAHWSEFMKEKNISSNIENDFYYRYPSEYGFILLWFIYVLEQFMKSCFRF